MKTMSKFLLCTFVLAAVTVQESSAQRYPERGLTRRGNRDYQKEEYSASEVDYRRALEKNPAFYEAGFNLGDAVYRQQRFDEAAKLFAKAAADSSASVNDAAQSFYNMGNALFMQQKYAEALEAYKQSLRLRPDDVDAKYNLAYTKKMLEQQQQQQQNKDDNDDNRDQNQEQDKNRNKDQDKDQDNNRNNEDGGDEKKDDDSSKRNPDSPSDPGGQDGKPKPSESEPDDGGISEQQAQQMLQAVQQQEDNTRDKMNEKKGVAVSRSGKNW